MLMLIGIAHVAAVQDQRVVEQSAFAILCLFQLVDEIRKALHVILIDLCVIGDDVRIFGMMRQRASAPGKRKRGLRQNPSSSIPQARA